MELDLVFILLESVEEMLLDKSRLLEELEVEVVDFEAEGQVELADFLIRTFQRFFTLVGDDFKNFDLFVDL